jgi:hypothetical protein
MTGLGMLLEAAVAVFRDEASPPEPLCAAKGNVSARVKLRHRIMVTKQRARRLFLIAENP